MVYSVQGSNKATNNESNQTTNNGSYQNTNNGSNQTTNNGSNQTTNNGSNKKTIYESSENTKISDVRIVSSVTNSSVNSETKLKFNPSVPSSGAPRTLWTDENTSNSILNDTGKQRKLKIEIQKTLKKKL